jgi:predicted ATPase/DNA-binding CsgD family transcriptional regulator
VPFVGRQDELNEIAALLADPACRLLTLLGPGGIGKTHLAIQAAANQIPLYTHGVHFVALTSVASPGLIASAIASTLQITFLGSEAPGLQIIRYLREKQMLLVMDNFEHLLEGTELLIAILQAAAGVKFLVTSRERLNIQEEWVLALDGLSFPEVETSQSLEAFSAVQLFVQRARQVNANFSLSQNEDAVKTICQQVEGMPLGLELAATWLRAMSCQQIAIQMTGNLDFLTTPLRNAPERHRSLRAVFEQSWNLLSPAEKDVLMRLSIFRGGFDQEAASYVAGASLTLLAGLADRSLIRLNANGRYDLHELLRQYAADQLSEAGETSETTARHFDFYLKLATDAETHAFGREQLFWFDRLEVELDNLRAALAWSLASETGLQLAAMLGWFFTERSHWREGFDWLERTITANPDAPASLRAKALHTAGPLAAFAGNLPRAQLYLEQSLALARATNDRWSTAWALSHLGTYTARDPDQGAALHDESLALFRELDDAMGITHSLSRRSFSAFDQQDYPYMRTLLEEAEIRARQAGDKVMLGWIACNMGRLAWYQEQNFIKARTLIESSLTLHREARLQMGVKNALQWLGQLELELGNLAEAETRNQEVLTAFRNIEPSDPYMPLSLVMIARIASARSQFERAARLFAAVDRYHVRPVQPRQPGDHFDADLVTVRTQLGETAFAREWAVGSAMTPDQIIAYALEDSSSPKQETVAVQQANDPGLAPPRKAASPLLSARELAILGLVAEGLSNREVADRLVLATTTVKWYISEIFRKLGVNKRTQAVAQARELGLL